MNQIDVELYRKNFINALVEEGMFEDYQNQLGIENVEKFQSLIEEELEFICAENVIEKGYATLNEDQYEAMIGRCLASYFLDELMAKGLIQKEYNEELNENVFTLTEKGKQDVEARFGNEDGIN